MRASKRSRNAHLVANRADKPLISVSTIPDDLKTDISSAVRAFTMVQVGGTCITRALVGNSLLRECGLDAQLTSGSLIYRAGPDPVADVVAYCGMGNVGYSIDGGILGHVWNELGGEVIDFSTGDWRSEGDLIFKLYPDGLPPVQWEVEPPEYLWKPAQSLKSAWRPIGSPALGQFWYGRWAPPKRPDYHAMEWAVVIGMGAVREQARRLCLIERVSEWIALAGIRRNGEKPSAIFRSTVHLTD